MVISLLQLLGKQVEAAVDKQVERRLAQLELKLNEFNYDAWGFKPEIAKYSITLFYWLYKYYWRVQVYGIDNVPEGRVLLIANHSGQLPMDGAMIFMAMLMQAKKPRLVRAMIERWFGRTPFIGTLAQRSGAILGDPINCERLLEDDQCVLVFPEGAKGSGKLWYDRYQLMDFGLGFMRLALKTKTPIVPISVIGGEEQAPSFIDVKPLARLLGLPYFPITPTFPWLGLLGLIPYPTKYHIYFGEPLYFTGASNESDEEVQKKVEVVKSKIYKGIKYGLAQRQHVFW
ncbi:MAG: lysophospholipid acyltransferase family protein [Acidobacteriota bacterium]|nr:acyltransferase family protein [Blastocatellia bacterium]MDW8411071.1 lysophospholipid acyltransferase family protein [Acidobacteriota bacterium]